MEANYDSLSQDFKSLSQDFKRLAQDVMEKFKKLTEEKESRSQSRSASPGQRGCFHCGDPFHFKASCPNLPDVTLDKKKVSFNMDRGDDSLNAKGAR